MKKIFFLILIILGLTACKKAAFDIVNIDAPFISTDSVKNIKIDSATVYFNINNPSNVKFNKVGICFDTITNNPNINNMVQLTDSGAVKGILKISLANLKINTKYYVRCFAIFNDSIFYGNVQTFTTNRLPTISLSINNITNSTANIHLGITNIEKTNFTKIGVYYSTTNMLPGTSNNDSSKILNNTGALSGTYILNLNNLVAGNIYYIRYFYVINGVQYISTQVQNFTAIILPMVQTDTANNITNNNATLNFSISNVAALNITAAGIAYSSSNSTPTSIHGYVALSSIGNLAGNYTINLSSLTANTLYYYRAYINYNGTIYYGSVRSFTT
ncbi:MAG: hypothetical protein ORN58_06225, partial [Sediminibacterium sp.]|nr:hypothetical protein [Sediminibacterium sp.]